MIFKVYIFLPYLNIEYSSVNCCLSPSLTRFSNIELTRCSDASSRVSFGRMTAARIVHGPWRPVAASKAPHTVSQSMRSWLRQPPSTGRTCVAPSSSSASPAHSVRNAGNRFAADVRHVATSPAMSLGRCIAREYCQRLVC